MEDGFRVGQMEDQVNREQLEADRKRLLEFLEERKGPAHEAYRATVRKQIAKIDAELAEEK